MKNKGLENLTLRGNIEVKRSRRKRVYVKGRQRGAMNVINNNRFRQVREKRDRKSKRCAHKNYIYIDNTT